MNPLNADEIVVSFWAIGPSFRKQLINNIDNLIKNYGNDMFKFIILTDYTDEFQYFLNKTNRCLDIIDINKQRKDVTWSFDHEIIPNEKTEAGYAIQMREMLNKGNKFSYSLHRFSIPWMIEHDVTNFIMIDPDIHFLLNTKLAPTLQHYVDMFLTVDCDTNYLIGPYGEITTDMGQIHFNRLQKLTGIEVSPRKILPMTDGPFRFYRFQSTSDVKLFYNTWNTALKMVFDDKDELLMHGGVIQNDEVILAAIYAVIQIQLFNLNPGAIMDRHRIENRYFMPTSSDPLIPTNSMEEFININKHFLIEHYKHKNYIDVLQDLMR